MNTGTHDIVNLGWRLAGVVNGWYKPEILSNYSDERRASAQQLIDNDKLVSALISGKKPDKYKHRTEDVMVLFDEVLKDQHAFSFGFGIEYHESALNDVQNSYPPIGQVPGQRAPDVLVYKNGFSKLPIRLYEVTKYNGKFHVLVFAGVARDTHSALQRLRSQVDERSKPFEHVLAFRTLIAGTGVAFAEHLGIERQFGDAYWDLDHRAHEHYKISLDLGALVVLRPDGILGFVAPLDGFDKVAEYLSKIAIPREPKKVVANGTNGHVGEMINQDENNLYYQQAREQGLPASVEQGHVPAT
jgi:phenol 2-monooxygenase